MIAPFFAAQPENAAGNGSQDFVHHNSSNLPGTDCMGWLPQEAAASFQCLHNLEAALKRRPRLSCRT
jgi:hypothetical protein